MKQSHLRSLLLFTLLFLLMPLVVLGQNTEELCRAFANRAFGDLGNNCANVGTNEACYGIGSFGEVTTTFYVDGTAQVIREDVFAEPSERVSLLTAEELETVESIVTEEFFLDRNNNNVDDNRLGIALLEVAANLPAQETEANSAVYILFGGTRIENGVFPEDALILGEPVSVSADTAISAYSSPEGLGYPVPSAIVGDASGTLEADGISPDGNWVRILFTYERTYGDRNTAWVKVADLSASDGIDVLPVIAPDSFTPMQRLFLSNVINTPTCEEIPNPGLLVQGPEETETDFVINETPVRVTSTAFFRQISAQRLQITALTGFTVLFPDSDQEQVIPEGFTQTICLSQEEDLGIDGIANDRQYDPNCPEGGPVPLTGNALNGLANLSGLPGNLLNYDFSIPTEICPSGVGNVQCITVPASPARIQEKCEAGQLPPAVCTRFGYGS